MGFELEVCRSLCISNNMIAGFGCNVKGATTRLFEVALLTKPRRLRTAISLRWRRSFDHRGYLDS